MESASTPDKDISISNCKASDGMKSKLEELMNILRCPLCHQLFTRPTTLASCGHTFCETCIDDHSCSSSICPKEGCRMPMSVVGGRRGSFRTVNVQLAQCVESFGLVRDALRKSPKDWWKHNNLQVVPPSEDPLAENIDEEESHGENASDSDMEDVVDLQENCARGQE